jgi:uncharacterized membrane protein
VWGRPAACGGLAGRLLNLGIMPDDPQLAELRKRVAQLEERVSALESRPPAVPSPTPSGSLESSFGLTFINRIGAITIAIGIVLFFKYAADNNWISPGAGLLLAFLGGVLLIGAGEWLRRRQQSVFAQGVAGCGLAILYIVLYSAHAYYHLTGLVLTFVFLASFTALGIALALRFGPDFLAPWNAFVFLCAAAALTPESHRIVFVACAWWLAALYALLRSPSKAVHVVAHAAFLIGALRALTFVVEPYTSPLNRGSVINELCSILLALYAIALIAFGVWRRSSLNRILGLALLGLVIVKLYIYDIWLLNLFYRISAFVALGVLLVAVSYLYSRFRDKLQDYFDASR